MAKFSPAFKLQQRIVKEAAAKYNSPENISGTKAEPIHRQSYQKILADLREYYGKAHNFGAAAKKNGTKNKPGKRGKKRSSLAGIM